MKATKKMITAVTTGIVTDVTTDNFQSYVDAVFSASKSIRDNIQVLAQFAIEHARDNHNNLDLITYLLKIASSQYGDGIRTATLQKYIETVVVGGKWMTMKGSKVFRKASNKTKISYDMDHLENVKWFNHDKKDKAVPKMDFLAMLEQTAKRWDKAHEKADAGEAELVNPSENDKLAAEFMKWLEERKPAQADAHADH